MNEARDIVGISVPFAAGVAMGVALYPLLSGGLPFITSSILLVLICITTLLVRFGKLSDRKVRNSIRNRQAQRAEGTIIPILY